MKKRYDLLILGATALSAGIVAAHPELDIVVLETTSGCAGEFTEAMKTDNAAMYTPKTEEAAKLAREMRNRHAMDPGGEWLPAVGPVLAGRLRESGADVYFFAVLKELEAEGDGYRAVFTAFGLEHGFFASRVIDTTARFESRRFFGEKEPVMADVRLNRLDASLTIRGVKSDGDMARTRLGLRPDDGPIVKTAWRLSRTPAEKRRDLGRVAWIPSSARGNFLEAWDDGAALSLPDGTAETVLPRTRDAGEYDVIVAGLGTAGAAAAVTALEEGLSVLAVESLEEGGGAATAGLVQSYYYGFHGGVYRKIDEGAHERDGLYAPGWGVGADQKIAQIDAMLEGASVHYGASLLDVLREGNRITGIRFAENGEQVEARAKFVLDCTADSAVCVRAGCEMLGGRACDGAMQPFSCVRLTCSGGRLGMSYIDDGRVNQYDPDDFGKAVLRALSSYLHLWDDYSSHTYLGAAPLIGLREGWRIRGEETLAFPELIGGAWPEKPLYYGWSNLDNHGKDNALESVIYQDWNTLSGMWGWGIVLPVPMGALIPRGMEGLLAAGRNVSTDHDISMGLRMKDDVQKSGEAAARMAAQAVRRGIPVREVDPDLLREKLTASGCIGPEDGRIMLEKQMGGELYEGDIWIRDDGVIGKQLASDEPGRAMWSARHYRKTELLRSLLSSENENARINAALTLAMLDEGGEDVIRILSEAALKRDGYLTKASRKYIVPRSVAAVYALGRLGDPAALPALYRLTEDEGFIDELPFSPYDLIADQEDYRFQYRSHLAAALCSVAKAHPEKKDEIRERLRRYVEGKRFAVTMMGTGLRYDDTDTVLRMIGAL